MKRILFIFIAVISLNSCGMMRYAEYSTTLKYTGYGDFFFTESNSVSFEYEPVGNVSSMVVSGYIKSKRVEATADDALEVLYNEAKKNRANGVINLKITYEWNRDKNGAITSLKSVSASGMAIRM